MQPASWWRGTKIETWYEYIVESWKIWYDNQIDLKYELHKNAKSTMTQHDKARSINKMRRSVCQGLDITFFSSYGIDVDYWLSVFVAKSLMIWYVCAAFASKYLKRSFMKIVLFSLLIWHVLLHFYNINVPNFSIIIGLEIWNHSN